MKGKRKICLRMGAGVMVGLVGSCVSPLSDIELTDPSAVVAECTISEEYEAGGNVDQEIYVVLKDRNYQWVELKSGGVSVNGTRMSESHWPLTALPYYTVSATAVPITYGAAYTFSIMLADSEEYDCSVTTPSYELSTFTVPDTQSRSDSLVITWAQGDNGCTMELRVRKQILADTVTSYSTDNFDMSPTTGRYRFLSSYFETGLQKIDFTLTYERQGQVDSQLRDNTFVKYSAEHAATVIFTN